MTTTGSTAVPIASDEELAKRMRSGDAAAFAALAERYWVPIHRIVRNLLADAVKVPTVVEETFLRAQRSPEWVPSDAPFKLSLYRLAIVLALIQRQRPGAAVLPRSGARRDLEQQIREGLEQVADLDRAAFVLREIEQLPLEEVAEILGSPPEAIRTSAHRACVTLTRFLGQLEKVERAMTGR